MEIHRTPEELLADFSENGDLIDLLNEFISQNVDQQTDVLLSFILKAHEIAVLKGYLVPSAWLLYWLGEIDQRQNLHDEALRKLLTAYSLFFEVSDVTGIVKVSHSLRNTYSQLCCWEPALDWANRVLDLSLGLDTPAVYKEALVMTAGLHLKLSEYNEVLELLDIADKLPSGDVGTEMTVLLLRGRVDATRGNPERALECFERAFKLSRKVEDHAPLADLHMARAEVLVAQNNGNDALLDYRKALNIAEKAENLALQAEILLAKGRLESTTGSRTRAIRFFQEALELAGQVSSNLLLSQIHGELSRVLGKEKETPAFTHYKKHHELSEAGATERSRAVFDRFREDRRVLLQSAQKTQNTQAEVLSEIGRQITESHDFPQLLDTIYRSVKRLMSADVFGVALFVAEKKALDYALFIEEGRRANVGLIPLDSPRSLGAYCFRQCEQVLVNDIDLEYKKYLREKSNLADKMPKSMIFCPLILPSGPIGILSVQSYVKNSYTTHHADLLSALGAYITIMIENDRLRKEVNDSGTLDPLTKLFSRRTLLLYGRLEWERRKRYGEPLCLVLLSLDHLKQINEQYGSEVGDEVLHGLANLLRELLREADIAGRYGAKDFLVVLTKTDWHGAMKTAERYQEALSEKVFELEGRHTLRGVSLSAGVHEFEDQDTSFEDGLKKVESALEIAKTGGKSKIHVTRFFS